MLYIFYAVGVYSATKCDICKQATYNSLFVFSFDSLY